MEGWIKLHRRIEEWKWVNDLPTLRLWLYILDHARHEDGNWNGVPLKAGQMVVGRKSFFRETGITEQTFRTSLRRLKDDGTITTKTTNKHTIVTIVNWGFYQKGEEKPTSKSTSNSTSNQPATNQQPTTNKNIKNERSINPQTPKGGSDTISALVDFAVTYGNVKDNGKTPLADLMRKFLSWGATVGEITDAVQLNSEWFNCGKSGLQRLVWAIHSGSTKDLTADELEAYNEWKTRQGEEECD